MYLLGEFRKVNENLTSFKCTTLVDMPILQVLSKLLIQPTHTLARIKTKGKNKQLFTTKTKMPPGVTHPPRHGSLKTGVASLSNMQRCITSVIPLEKMYISHCVIIIAPYLKHWTCCQQPRPLIHQTWMLLSHLNTQPYCHQSL
jgi:hypothetical protein